MKLGEATRIYPISIGSATKGKYKAYPLSVAYETRCFSDTLIRLLGICDW